jgi:hypothetical protein
MTWGRRLYFPSEGNRATEFYRPYKSIALNRISTANLAFIGKHDNHYTTENDLFKINTCLASLCNPFAFSALVVCYFLKLQPHLCVNLKHFLYSLWTWGKASVILDTQPNSNIIIITTVLGTSRIIKKVLQSETWSLSGGINHWLKRRSAREKKPCDERTQ